MHVLKCEYTIQAGRSQPTCICMYIYICICICICICIYICICICICIIYIYREIGRSHPTCGHGSQTV